LNNRKNATTIEIKGCSIFLNKIADTEQVGEQVTEQVKRLLVGISDKKSLPSLWNYWN